MAAADYVGSTEYIIKDLDAAPPGSKWAIGTELNLVCSLAEGKLVNRIQVDPETESCAKLALKRMLALP